MASVKIYLGNIPASVPPAAKPSPIKMIKQAIVRSSVY